jgi:hypothetical protein
MPNETVAGLMISIDANTVKLRTEMDRAKASTRDASRQMVSDMQETRAGIKQIGEEIGVNLNRHLVSFLAKIPGADIFAKAFPIAAVAGIGMAFVESGKKAYEFLEKTRAVAGEMGEAMRKMRAETDMSNDELDLTNKKIEEQIAKLERRPVNGLATALAEARVEADKLAKSLDTSAEKLGALLKEKSISAFGGLLTNQASTKGGEAMVGRHLQAIGAVDEAEAEELRNAKPGSDTDAIRNKFQVQRLAAIDAAIKESRDNWNKLDAWNKERMKPDFRKIVPGRVPLPQMDTTDVTAQMTLYGGAAQQFGRMRDTSALMYTQATDNERLHRDEGAHGASKMAQWRQDLEAQKAQHTMTLDEEAVFWQKRAGSVMKGSADYNAALLEANRDRAESQRQYLAAFISGAMRDSEAQAQQHLASQRTADELGAAWVASEERDREAAREMQQHAERAFQGAVAQQKSAEKMAEERVKLEEAAGRLTHGQAAQQMLQIHQETFAAWSSSARGLSAQFPDLATPGAAEALGNYGTQTMQDQAAIDASTALGGLRDGANKLAEAFTDLPSILPRELTSALNSVNDELVRLMTTQYRRGDWKAATKPIFTDAAKSAMQFGEGSIMSMIPGLKGLPHGKLGTRGNPMYTRSADGGGAAGASLTGALGGAAGAGDAGSGGVGGFLGILGGVAKFAGFMAEGGVMQPGGFYLTGERGPELVSVGSSSRISNARDTSKMMGGGDTHHHWNIDARGATDPAMVRRQVQDGIMAAAPHIAAGAIRANNDMAWRRPNYKG